MKYKLSICIPTYNRRHELIRLFSTIPQLDQIQIVVSDDGSDDDTFDFVESIRQLYKVKYLRHKQNMGRAHALHRAIKAADGEFVMIMDSDDYFTKDGVTSVLDAIHSNQSYSAFLFGTTIIKNGITFTNIPPAIVNNYISIRADYKFKHDFKEVFRNSVVGVCNYLPPVSCRRVPTSLILSCIAENYDCLCLPVSVAVKEYLRGGMSDNILMLKTRYALPMKNLYYSLSESRRYKSKLSRIKYRLLWACYSFHSSSFKVDKLWQLFFIFPGFLLYLLNKTKLLFFYRASL